ncbi:MAG: GlsB/YeaQ/YmgE family stress response membrane protein [Acidimicrobiia bacterium]|nr:GlsB/YeaQ/YmgE family stress response membrane protein [Acidimicrobiia bacterium]MDH4306772.1 GlsB/YeaQ/YmgE family stress response membrane protein [Acidimicrobiia bacterium]MDH5293400.1 GlsB/YeaQ/YmgE family stress response membrane protein [Acidimicrobiia bacterium]
MDGLIGFLVIGLVAGWLGRALLPGPDKMGIGKTLLIGLAGSLVGGLVGNLATGEGLSISPAGLIGSTLGAIAVLLFLRSRG